MTRLLSVLAAVWLLVPAGASFAATAPLPDEVLAPLTAAYDLAVQPGEQAGLHRELFAIVLQRVNRSYAREVDMAGLVKAAPATLVAVGTSPQTTKPRGIAHSGPL